MTQLSIDTAKLAETFWKEGYIHIPGFFDTALMDELTGLIEEHFGLDPNFEHNEEFLSKASTEVVPWFPQREGVPNFDALEQDERLLALTDEILGEGWNSQYCMVMFSKEGTAGQAWHQDCPPEGKEFNLNRLVYTSSIVDEIGGQVVILPRSHKMGELTAGEPHEDLSGEVVLKPQKGDLVLLHGHCWHRVLPIKSKHRFSTNLRSGPAGTPEDITDICVYRNMRYQFSTSEVVVDRTVSA